MLGFSIPSSTWQCLGSVCPSFGCWFPLTAVCWNRWTWGWGGQLTLRGECALTHLRLQAVRGVCATTRQCGTSSKGSWELSAVLLQGSRELVFLVTSEKTLSSTCGSSGAASRHVWLFRRPRGGDEFLFFFFQV